MTKAKVTKTHEDGRIVRHTVTEPQRRGQRSTAGLFSGKLKWYFQTVHHDLWDYDPPSPPGLFDVRINGQTVPILAQTSKTGYMYILNRVTGKPVFGIEERPVPHSNVPGEGSSPTRPIPMKPAPLALKSATSTTSVLPS